MSVTVTLRLAQKIEDIWGYILPVFKNYYLVQQRSHSGLRWTS